MEQTTNPDHSIVEDEGVAWKGVGALASAWVARLAAEREAEANRGYVPVAWAAE